MANELNIFSLNKFRKIKSNSYNNKEACLKNSGKYGANFITNPRFKTFDQTYFHAGDWKDINKYALLPLEYYYSKEYFNNKKSGDNEGKKMGIFKLYKNIDYNSVVNTMNYLFYKFKKGIFVIIRDNKLAQFLPFSNYYYKNNWYKNIYFTDEEKRLIENTKDYNTIKEVLNKKTIDFMNKHPEQFKGRKIDFRRDEWYANNCVFRNLFPKYEGELNINVYKDMLEELLREREIPDVEFFINDRDFPLIKKDMTEPYNHLFNSDKVMIEKEFQFKKMCPLFSKSVPDNFADMIIPTNDDWTMASGKYFTASCSDDYHKESWDKIVVDWKKKKDICIFRGSATGCGITLENNMRLKAADISVDYPDLLDAGITNWQARMKKYSGSGVDIIDSNGFRFKLANMITNAQKSEYKYILHIDGYVSAYRLSSELSMNSVILIVKSNYKLWFHHMLEEYVHYVPVKEDLSDLIDQIKWCKKNDKKCKEIANNARELFLTKLSRNGILDYMQSQLQIIHSNRKGDNLLDIKKSKKNIAIITVFRDTAGGERSRQRKIFIELMSSILKPYFNFHIYIIEQSDDGEKFNIGKLKNIGFDISSKEGKYDNYIFSDIDIIPDHNLIPYFHIRIKYPIALGIRGTRYESGGEETVVKKLFLGTLIGFDKKTFTKINGYPNNFWGWGGEDDALMVRIANAGIHKIYYPENGSVIDFEEIVLKEKLQIVNKNMLKREKLYHDINTWKENGLSDLKYKILGREEINNDVSQIKVNLLKKKSDDSGYKSFPNNQKKEFYKIMAEHRENLEIEYI